jgi:hypothetical protein
MWFPGVRSVHTIGMLFAIDVLFLDKSWKTTVAYSRVRPGRICFAPPATAHCIELVEGALSNDQVTDLTRNWTIEQAI